MAVKQKPAPNVVKKSAKELEKAQSVKLKRVKPIQLSEDARILADQKNAPNEHKPLRKPSPRRPRKKD